MTSLIISILVVILIFIISSLPLYFAVKFLSGKTTILKTVLINLIAGLIVSAIQYKFKTYGGILAFIILIWIYHEAFRLKWLKAFFVWILQFIFIALFYVIAAIIGISLIPILF